MSDSIPSGLIRIGGDSQDVDALRLIANILLHTFPIRFYSYVFPGIGAILMVSDGRLIE